MALTGKIKLSRNVQCCYFCKATDHINRETFNIVWSYKPEKNKKKTKTKQKKTRQGEIHSITLMTNNSILLLGFWFTTIIDRPFFFFLWPNKRERKRNSFAIKSRLMLIASWLYRRLVILSGIIFFSSLSVRSYLWVIITTLSLHGH